MTVVEREVVRESVPVTTADVLNRAADLLEEFGWCQQVRVCGSGADRQFCLVGAVAQAARDLRCPPDTNEYAYAARLLGSEDRHGRGAGKDLWRFNDAPGRTKAEVVAKIRDAARNAA